MKFEDYFICIECHAEFSEKDAVDELVWFGCPHCGAFSIENCDAGE